MIELDISFAIAAFVGIFAIVNPIGNISFFLTLTEGYSKGERHKVVVKVVTVATAVLITFAVAGTYIFEFFHITVPAFRIAGGLILLRISFSMLQGQKPKTKLTKMDEEDALSREAVGIVPLGIPMFAGPGAITTVMIYTSDASDMGGLFSLEMLFVYLAIILIALISYILLNFGEWIFERMGKMGAVAFSRIMGLILAAIAVQFIINGIVGAAQMNGII